MLRRLTRRSRIIRPALQSTRPGSCIVAQIPHTSTLPNGAVGQSDSEELHAAIGTSPGVVPIVAAMRAPPRHRSAAGSIGKRRRFSEIEVNLIQIRGSELHDPIETRN